jgi:hypothetical protein
MLEDYVVDYEMGNPIEQDYDGLSPEIKATSAGYETRQRDRGNYKSYFTVGERVYTASRRGWNVLLFDAKSNKVISHTAFDTHGDVASVQRCIDFLNAVPPGTIVALAVFDEGAKNTHKNVEFSEAVRRCGVKRATLLFRASFAMIGCKVRDDVVHRGVEAVEVYDAEGAPVTVTRPATTSYKW